MKAHRKTARSVGTLYVVGTVAGILSLVFRGPVGNIQDYLARLFENETRLVVGALFVLTMGLVLAMVPVVMFPILRKLNEALALGYVVFRGGLETVGYLTIATGWLLLVPLSQIYVQAGASDASNAQALGTLDLLHQTNLVSRWLSGWALIAGVLHLASGLSNMFGIIPTLGLIYVVLNVPKALQQMGLALWPIVRGFNSSAGAAKFEQRT